MPIRTVEDLDDDTLIAIFNVLPVEAVLAMRMTCRRMESISRLRIVWHNAYVHEVLGQGFPFPGRPLVSMDAAELEHRVRFALRLGHFWLRSPKEPRILADFQASSGNGISDIQFLPGYHCNRVVTVSKGIWSIITCWDISSCGPSGPRKLAEWCPKGALFSGFTVNSDPDSEGAIATSVITGRGQDIRILSLVTGENDKTHFATVCSIHSVYRPIALHGDIIACSDDSVETAIMNWRTGAAALLCSADTPVDHNFQYNRCIRVIFAHNSILVVRARSVELFAQPVLYPRNRPSLPSPPVANHSFGWIDGVSVSSQLCGPDTTAHVVEPLSILLRAETDDPWSSGTHTLELFSIYPDPEYPDDDDTPLQGGLPSPYLFPPIQSQLSIPCARGFLRCTDIVLGRYGTAIWIQPRPSRHADLTTYDVHASEAQAPEGARASESLIAAVFPGPLQRLHPKSDPGARTLWTNNDGGGNWNAIAYEEEMGRIVLGSTNGRVTVLELG